MLKNRKERPCDCGSGIKYGKCCGSPEIIEAERLGSARQCGECQACCDLMAVEQLGKPFGTNCEHQCTAGCAIYDYRPRDCRAFVCAWKVWGHMADDLRPDKSGIMVCTETDLQEQGLALYLYEVRDGAFGAISRQSSPQLVYI